MFSRISYEVSRAYPYPEPVLIWTLKETADKHGLRGVIYCLTEARYSVMLEGSRDRVAAHKTFVEYLLSAIGDVRSVEVTHRHNHNAFAVSSVCVFFP